MAKLKDHRSSLLQRKTAATADIKEVEVKKAEIMDYVGKLGKTKVMLNIDQLVDAPDDWNFFPPLQDLKRLQLKLSIRNSSIFEPIIVWKKSDGKYMILAGHNRVHISRELIEEEDRSVWEHDYTQIPAIIYEEEEIDEDKAKEIIIDTNYLQRGALDPKLRGKVIKYRYDIARKQKDCKGDAIAKLSEAFKTKKSALYQDIQIESHVVRDIQDLYYDGKLTRKAVLKLTGLPEEMQQWLFDEHPELLVSKQLMKLSKSDKTKEDVLNTLSATEESTPAEIEHIRQIESKCTTIKELYLVNKEFAAACDELLNKYL